MPQFVINTVWPVLGLGAFVCLEYMLFGCIFAITYVGWDSAKVIWSRGGYAMRPFGRTLVRDTESSLMARQCGHILWILPGILICVTHLLLGSILYVTYIGRAMARKHFDMAKPAIFMFGFTVVHEDDAPSP